MAALASSEWEWETSDGVRKITRLVLPKRVGSLGLQDLSSKLASRKLRPGDKSHQGAKAPSGGSTYKVKTRNGGFKARIESWVSIDLLDGCEQALAKETIAGDIDSVARSEQNVIYKTIPAVVKFHH
jgi:hypothetical protein